MGNFGIGAMAHYLGGGSEHNPDEYYGKVIKAAEIKEDELLVTFDDGKKIKIFDAGQSCCEFRYMTCDDHPKDLEGNKLVKIEVKEVVDKEPKDEYDEEEEHEIAFLEVATDKSFITIATHNEHNGYYGGFGLSIKEIAGEAK